MAQGSLSYIQLVHLNYLLILCQIHGGHKNAFINSVANFRFIGLSNKIDKWQKINKKCSHVVSYKVFF